MVDLLGAPVKMQMDLVLVDGGVQMRIQHHGRRAGVLLVVVWSAVVIVVAGIRRVRAPVVWVISVVVWVTRTCAHHGVQVRFGAVEHRRWGC